MRLLSWNVNGIRAIMKKDFLKWLDKEQPDILCLQETKANPEQVQLKTPGYRQYWSSAEKKGYSGTLILTKEKPLEVNYGMGIPEHDNEGRVITLEFGDFHLVNVYSPNAQRTLTRLDYRQIWDKDFLAYIQNLDKPTIFCGDLNVAHTEIDLARPKDNQNNAGFTKEERSGFQNLIDAGFIDTFREFKKDGGHYTWWSYMFNARAKNLGWRIDYFLISPELRPRLKDAFIMADVMGSDHCPVGIEMDS